MGYRVHQVIPTILLWIILVQVLCCQAQNRNIKLIAMNGNQYWFSSTSPYSPQLNFHLAYQYCRTLGLQLAVLETKEEVDLIASYLKTTDGNTGREYWTSGNKLGSDDSWIWMSSGEQLNTTFSEYWLQQKQQSAVGTGRNCMTMQVSSLSKRTLFSPEDCGKPLSFICEQLRCLYYNYPVTPFPDPEKDAEIAALRADLDSSSSTDSVSQSRSFPHLFQEDSLRIQNYLLNAGKDKYAEQNLPYALRRRISMSPSMSSSLQETQVIHQDKPESESQSQFSHRFGEPVDSNISSTTTSSPPSNTTAQEPIFTTSTTFPLGSTKPPPNTDNLNFVTVKNVLVSKSEKVSYSSNYSNIHGIPLAPSPYYHGQKAYYRQHQPPQQRPISVSNPSSNDFLSGIQVDSVTTTTTHQEHHEHEATETVFYDDIPQGHTENYHFDDSETEIISSQENDGMNKDKIVEPEEPQPQPQIPIKMFQFQRSKVPVSWSFKTKR